MLAFKHLSPLSFLLNLRPRGRKVTWPCGLEPPNLRSSASPGPSKAFTHPQAGVLLTLLRLIPPPSPLVLSFFESLLPPPKFTSRPVCLLSEKSPTWTWSPLLFGSCLLSQISAIPTPCFTAHVHFGAPQPGFLSNLATECYLLNITTDLQIAKTKGCFFWVFSIFEQHLLPPRNFVLPVTHISCLFVVL